MTTKEDQELMEEMNAASLGDRLQLVIKMIEQSVGPWDQAEPFNMTIVEHPEVFETALKLLKNLAENEGKVKW